jgi:hypothetical protein
METFRERGDYRAALKQVRRRGEGDRGNGRALAGRARGDRARELALTYPRSHALAVRLVPPRLSPQPPQSIQSTAITGPKQNFGALRASAQQWLVVACRLSAIWCLFFLVPPSVWLRVARWLSLAWAKTAEGGDWNASVRLTPAVAHKTNCARCGAHTDVPRAGCKPDAWKLRANNGQTENAGAMKKGRCPCQRA